MQTTLYTDANSQTSEANTSESSKISTLTPGEGSQSGTDSSSYQQNQEENSKRSVVSKRCNRNDNNDEANCIDTPSPDASIISCASGGVKDVRKRVMANERERERTKSLNQALELLRNRLPVPEAEKRSKIQTLRMAKEYIEFLALFKRMTQQQQEQQSFETVNHINLVQNQQVLTSHCRHLSNQAHPSEINVIDNFDELELPAHNLNQYDSIRSLTYKFYKFRLKSKSRNQN